MKGDSRRGVDGIDNAILDRSGRTCREIMLLVSFENLKFLTSFSIFDLFDLLKIFNILNLRRKSISSFWLLFLGKNVAKESN